MAVVSKKRPVVAAPEEKKVATPVVAKKNVEKNVENTAAPVAKKAEVKKISLTGNTKAPKSFEIKEGSQATQEAFIDRFYKKLLANSYDVNKEMVKTIKKAYGETLKEVLEIASYQDVDSGLYYARRFIKSRVTEPPKAKGGLKTLMAGHYEIKVRKLVGDESTFKFFGDLNEDGTIFITTDGEEIPVSDEVEVKPVAKKKVAVKKTPVPIVVEEEDDDADVNNADVDADEDDFDDFLDDEE